MRIILLFCFLLLGQNVVLASAAQILSQIKIVGLFKSKAIVDVRGKTVVVSRGQTFANGIKLISANSNGAILEIDGRKYLKRLNRSIGVNYSVPASSQVKILSNKHGQYITKAKINSHELDVLIDTGANFTTLNSIHAQKAGLDYLRYGRKIKITTASEQKIGFVMKVDKISLGSISLNNTEVTIIEGQYPEVVLLGMSFLKYVTIRYKDNILVIERN